MPYLLAMLVGGALGLFFTPLVGDVLAGGIGALVGSLFLVFR